MAIRIARLMDEFRSQKTGISFHHFASKKIGELEATIDKQATRIQALEARNTLLLKYASHKWECNKSKDFIGNDSKCTCGLDELLNQGE